MSTKERIAAVLAEHRRADWSDGTFACHGCKDRSPDAFRHEGDTPEEAKARYERYNKLIYPGWTFEEYNMHVAAHVTLQLTLRGEDDG